MNIRWGHAGTFTKEGRMTASMADTICVACVADLRKGRSCGLSLNGPSVRGSRMIPLAPRRGRW